MFLVITNFCQDLWSIWVVMMYPGKGNIKLWILSDMSVLEQSKYDFLKI